jgi:hypothetical protein
MHWDSRSFLRKERPRKGAASQQVQRAELTVTARNSWFGDSGNLNAALLTDPAARVVQPVPAGPDRQTPVAASAILMIMKTFSSIDEVKSVCALPVVSYRQCNETL